MTGDMQDFRVDFPLLLNEEKSQRRKGELDEDYLSQEMDDFIAA